jgi:DNA-binding PadR family transcriptional regulator
VYHITDSGRAELRQWIAGPPPMSEPRSAPLIQVFFSGQLSDQEILAKFEQYAAIMRGLLTQYEQVLDHLGPFQEEIPSPREHFFWLLTRENGIANMRANLAWAENVIERIKNGQLPKE